MIGLILAGGSGTRLQSVVKDKPKPLAEVKGRPFIRHLTDYLFNSGFVKLYISCFYLGLQIEDEYKKEIIEKKIEIITEPKKLGTGGAIFYCLERILNDNVFVFNGDSFVNIPFNNFFQEYLLYLNQSINITIVSAIVPNTGRYGVLDIDNNNTVIAFKEKEAIANQTKIEDKPINAGVYLINRKILNDFPELQKYNAEFSFEHEVLIPLSKQKLLKAFVVKNDFIDIGIPEDYQKAQTFFD